MLRPRWRERACLCVVLLAAPVLASCGSVDGPPAIHVKQGAHRLTSLLRESGVTPGKRSVKSKQSLGSAWAAFKEFAAVPVQRSELSDEPLSDGLLFEFGVFAFGGKWGKTFQLNFVRQLATADGDLQQVHLVVHFAPATFERIKNRVKAAPCADAEGCAARCSFVETDILGSSCVLSLARDRTARSTGHELASASVWSFDTGGSDTQAQRTSWIAFVESSPVFTEVARTLKPLGYEVWQGSAE